MLETVQNEMDRIDTTLDKVSRYNEQLRKPAHHDDRRDALLSRWREGYEYIEKDFRAEQGARYYKRKILDLIRPEWKRFIKTKIRMLRKH